MSNRQLRRNLRLLASTSVVALALTAAPVSVRVLPTAPAWHFEAPSSQSSVVTVAVLDQRAEFASSVAETARREALERLGLSEGMSYMPPVLLTLSQARAGSGGSGGGGSGGGGSGGAGGSGGGSGDASGASGSDASAPGSAGATGGSFGDVEQVGPSLSQDEEAMAIGTGWQ